MPYKSNSDSGAGKKRTGNGEQKGERKPFKKSDKPFNKEKFGKRDERGERKFSRDGERQTGGDRGFKSREGSERKGGFNRDGDKPARDFNRGKKPFDSKGDFKRPEREERGGFERKGGFNREGDRPAGDFNRGKNPFAPKDGFKRPDREDRDFKRDGDRPKRDFSRDKKPYESRGGDYKRSDRQEGDFKRNGDRPKRDSGRDKKPYESRGGDYKRPESQEGDFDRKPKFKIEQPDKGENPFDKAYPLGTRKVSGPFRKKFKEEQEGKAEKPARKPKTDKNEEVIEEMTLNKYIAHSGECSRRDAAALVKQGKVKVNGELVLEPGYRVKAEDRVTIAGKKLTPQRDFVYVLLNKPKGYITTTEDPEERKTVMELVEGVEVPRLYPVGRLDRNTTGLILLTNDGDLAQKLSHPSYEVKKIYQVTLDKPLTKGHFEQILNGVELEDGIIQVDALSFLESKNELGLEIHSGRNRIVRRIFETLGYEVEKLDRVMYAGLTKKNIPRGKWRLLNEREIVLLKHFKN